MSNVGAGTAAADGRPRRRWVGELQAELFAERAGLRTIAWRAHPLLRQLRDHRLTMTCSSRWSSAVAAIT